MASSNSKDMESERSADSVMPHNDTVQASSNGKDMTAKTHNDTVQASSNSTDMKSETHNDTVQDSSNSMDMECKRLVDSALTMMVCVQACRISAVPKRHGKSQVEEVYTPRAVSIGLLHRGTSTDLLHMEDIKWRSMFYLLHRTDDMMVSLQKCTELVLSLDEIVRASYNVNEFKYNSYDLAKIMLSDGCFLLELLISGSPQLNTQLKCRLEVPKRVAEISKREVVLSDLTVIENQIPLVILTELAKELFVSGVCKVETMLPLFGYSSDSGVKSSHNPAHILELVHSFIGREIKNLNDNRECKQVRVNINTKNYPNPKPILKLCATKLEAAGVKLKPPEKSERGLSHMEKIRFDLKITFDDINKTLEIPQLYITETTEAKWKNFIAWELTKNEDKKSTDENNAIGSIFFWYALFFQGLLCSVHDIQLLRDKRIIVVHDAQSGKKKNKKLMSNEELLIFFSNLTEGVHDDDQIVEDYHFSMLFQDLNSLLTPSDWVRSVSRSIWYICIIMWHACRRVVTRIWQSCRKSFKILISEHITTRWKLIVIVAAILTFALTFTQTFFPDPFHFH